MRHSAKSKIIETSRQEPAYAPSEVELGQGFGQNTVPTDPTVPIVPSDDAPTEEAPPPVYNELYGSLDISQDGLNTNASLANDGRVEIRINEKSNTLSNLITSLPQTQSNGQDGDPNALPPPYVPPSLGGQSGQTVPSLNVVMHVVGTRADVQPFVALGQVLKKTYGHRVRLATHTTLKVWVEDNGLEFFNIGGDPVELTALMVNKNPSGMLPGTKLLRSGEIIKRRECIYNVLKACWRSCFESGDGINTEDSHQQQQQLLSSADLSSSDSVVRSEGVLDKPFVADAIIANPPSFAHVHCAEKLGIPLHLMYTMPWSPTQTFPHPLANIQSSNANAGITNFVSYAIIEMMKWQGLGDVMNRFREKILGLEPISAVSALVMASQLKIPYMYCWSPAVIPKPKDWGPHISVSGYCSLSVTSNYAPEPDLAAFLGAGQPPLYFMFESKAIDSDTIAKLITAAVEKTGQRALISSEGGFLAGTLQRSENLFILDQVPHEWLFEQVSCIIHHGSFEITAAAVSSGKPSVVVPFYGDQPFWGASISKAGACPPPIPCKKLNSENLATCILEALNPTYAERAIKLGHQIQHEDGCDVAAKSFHRQLELDNHRCALAPNLTAVWRLTKTDIRLSAFAAATLSNEGLIEFNDLRLYRPREYNLEQGPMDPISGGTSALLATVGGLMVGILDLPVEIVRSIVARSSEGASGAETSRVPTAENQTRGEILTPASSRSSFLMEQTSQVSTSAKTSNKGFKSASSAFNAGFYEEISGGKQSARSTNGKPNRSPSDEGSASSSTVSGPSLDAAVGAGKGLSRIVETSLKMPLDFTLGLARGFRNAPKMYGDDTVRPAEKVKGFRSGIKVASKEFGLGFYDGISGLVTQPVQGAKKDGVLGSLKGFGKGLGGAVLKPGAAVFGVPGYLFQGIYKEVQNHLGADVQSYIIAARCTQGIEAWQRSTPDQRRDVIDRWRSPDMERRKQQRGALARWHSAQLALGKKRQQRSAET
ncbi:hypothetical protein MMC07_000997 [Pseudocyphellaria aurata]|nr:hypothetical protein [Pseudocyphellaria aurata]